MSRFSDMFASMGAAALRQHLGEPVTLAYSSGTTVQVPDAIVTRNMSMIVTHPDGRRLAREAVVKVNAALLPTPPGSPVIIFADGTEYDSQVITAENGLVWFRATRPELTERAAGDYRQKRT
jgi:hypothetical protein